MLKSTYDLYELVIGTVLPRNLPPMVSIRMPEIPPSVPNSAEYLFSQLEEIIKRTDLEEGSTREYRLMLDLGSYGQFCSEKPEDLAEEKWLRGLSSQLNKIARQYNLGTLGIFTDEKIKLGPGGRKYQAIRVSLFRPVKLRRDSQSEE